MAAARACADGGRSAVCSRGRGQPALLRLAARCVRAPDAACRDSQLVRLHQSRRAHLAAGRVRAAVPARSSERPTPRTEQRAGVLGGLVDGTERHPAVVHPVGRLEDLVRPARTAHLRRSDAHPAGSVARRSRRDSGATAVRRAARLAGAVHVVDDALHRDLRAAGGVPAPSASSDRRCAHAVPHHQRPAHEHLVLPQHRDGGAVPAAVAACP